MLTMDLRAAVVAAMERRGWTAYRLWKELGGKVNKQTVYNFLEHGADIRSGHLGLIFDALDISLDSPAKEKRRR